MQIHRRRHRHRAFDDGGSRIGLFTQPFEQHIAAKRYADDIDFAVGIFALEPAQDPVDLGAIARVIGARQLINLAAASAKVRHDAAPTHMLCAAHQTQRVVAARTAFEAVKQHEQLIRCSSARRPIEVDEVAVRRHPSFAPILHPPSPRELARVNSLQVPTRQPPRRRICGMDQTIPLSAPRFRCLPGRFERFERLERLERAISSLAPAARSHGAKYFPRSSAVRETARDNPGRRLWSRCPRVSSRRRVAVQPPRR